MTEIAWREKMSIDHAMIDEDHRHLIEIINRFTRMAQSFSSPADALEILFALKFYTKSHFDREETLQRLAGYPYFDAHCQEHAELIRELDDMIAQTQAADGASITEISRGTAELLHTWLVDHIIKSDLRLAPYVEAMKTHMSGIGALQDIKQG